MNGMKRSLIAVVGIGLGLLLPIEAAWADSSSIRDLTAQWWQWALSMPPSVNPVLDPTGAYCALGQRGSTWFLGSPSRPSTT
jgi:hypothetical protein